MTDLTQADWERIIRPLILDTDTNEARWVQMGHGLDGATHWWGEGGGSCDCNRAIAFTGHINNPCGSARYIIIDIAERDEADSVEAILRYVNQYYPQRAT